MANEPDDTGAALGADDVQTQGDAPQLSETEQLAVEMGWRPERDYSGAAPWKPARDFILTEREISRETKKSVKHLREQVDRLAAASTKQTERALLRQADELNRQFAEAVENKDKVGAAQAAKGMRELEASARADATPADPEAIERTFSGENPWYGTDIEATEYAQFISQRELAKGIPFDRHKDTVVAAVRKRFPELDGGKPKPKDPPQLHAPSGAGVRRKEKGYADLPAEVKRAADSHAKLASTRFKIDPEKAKADYARDYFSDVAA